MEQFSERLKNWRGHRRQKEAATDLGLKIGTYRSWEKGKRTPKQHTLAEVERLMESHKHEPSK